MNSEQEQQQSDVEISLGKRLKSAREAQDLSAKDVADSLRLRVSVIEEIEKDNFDSNQIPAYTRGYTRAYAKLVGIDAASLLKQSSLGATEQSEVQMQSFSRMTRLKRNDNRLMMLTWAIVSIFAGTSIIWWWQSSQEEITARVVEQRAENVSPSQPVTMSLEPLAIPVTNSVSPVSTANSEEIQIPVAVIDPPVAEIPEPAVVEIVDAPTIAMNFIGDCWVDIRDGDGKRLLTGIKSRGESVELEGKEPFKIVLGAPSAVELTYKGSKIDLSGYPPKRVARLTLPQN